MMASSNLISAPVEIYENERRWLGGGFSHKGLLPTERNAYSSKDGSLSYHTLEKAGEALLGIGWIWDPNSSEYEVQVSSESTDQDGWSYSIDFSTSNLEAASNSQRMKHFARRRKLIRTKVLDLNAYFHVQDTRCEYCDSEAVDALSSKLLETLAVATLLQRDAQQLLTDAIALSLKQKLIDSLNIGSSEFPEWARKVDSRTRLRHVIEELGEFPSKQKNVLAQVFQPNQVPEGLLERMKLVANRYFVQDEREAFASLVVRQWDAEGLLHCSRETCSEECEFYRVTCPNEGCSKRVSRKHVEWHANKVCGYAVIDCPNECGDSFPRNRREVHLVDACSMRAMTCPLYGLGCVAMVKAKDRERHVDENAQGHLVLAAKRMEEYGLQLQAIAKRIDFLERENACLKKQLITDADLSKREILSVQNQVKAASKKLSALEKRCNSEFRSHAK